MQADGQQTHTILVVDDDRAIRTLVGASLEHAGYTVLVAADGVEGVSVFKQRQSEIALLITDVMMPNMNGFNLANCILELDAHLPVIFISGNLQHAERGHQCLAKPFTYGALISTVRQAINSAPPEPQSKAKAA